MCSAAWVRDISQGKRIRFLHGYDRLVGTVNGEALLHDGDLYIPVYVSDGDRCLIVHSSNIEEVLP